MKPNVIDKLSKEIEDLSKEIRGLKIKTAAIELTKNNLKQIIDEYINETTPFNGDKKER